MNSLILRHPACYVSPIHWTDYTHDSERGHAVGVSKVFRRSVSFPLGTRDTYVA